MSPKASMSFTWVSFASKLRGPKSRKTSAPRIPKSESILEAEWNAEIRGETKAARRRAKKMAAKKSSSPQCHTPVLERRLVVWHKCPWFGYTGSTSGKKKETWYEQDGDVMKFLIKDLSEYTLMRREECETETPELLAAVDRWLSKRKNRRKGWQFKCTIADGEKKISNRIPSRFGTFVVYVLIERVVECQCGGGLGQSHIPLEDVGTAEGNNNGYRLSREDGRDGREGAHELHDMPTFQRPCRTCGLSTWIPSGHCDDIHIA